MKPIKQRLHRSFGLWIFFHFMEYIYIYVFAFFSLYFLHYFQARLPELAKDLSDQLIASKIESIYLGEFIWLAIAIFVLRTSSRWLFFFPARLQQRNLRLEFINYLQYANPDQYSDYSKGQLFQLIINDFNRLRGLIGFSFLQLANIIIASFVILPKIVEVNLDLVYCFIPALGSVFLFALIVLFFRRYLNKGIEFQEQLQNFIIESYHGKKTIRTFNKENSFIQKFQNKSNLELSAFLISSNGTSLVRPLVPLGTSISFLWGAWKIYELGLGASTIVWYSGFLFILLEPLMMLSWIVLTSITAKLSWNRLKEFLNKIETEQNRKNSVKVSKISENLELYQRNLNFEINGPQIIGLCGSTASGKSYLLNQLASKLKFKNISFNFIFQTPFIFNASIKENIFLGSDPTNEKLKQAKDLIDLFELTTIFDSKKGFDTIIGELGKNISGGQAKRLVLVRSLLSDDPILIWDDPFSSVDVLLEEKIFNRLKDKQLKDKILILSSHRMSTFKFCDQYLLLDQLDDLRIKNVKNNLQEGDELNEFFKHQIL